MCWNSVKTIEFSIIQREHNCCPHKSYMSRGLFRRLCLLLKCIHNDWWIIVYWIAKVIIIQNVNCIFLLDRTRARYGVYIGIWLFVLYHKQKYLLFIKVPHYNNQNLKHNNFDAVHTQSCAIKQDINSLIETDSLIYRILNSFFSK